MSAPVWARTGVANETATALGLAGTEPGSNPAVPLVGTDVNLREPAGVFNVLLRLKKALETNNNSELTRVNALAENEQTRLTSVRGDLGQRMQTLDQIGNRLKDQDIVAHMVELIEKKAAEIEAAKATAERAAKTAAE